MKPALLDILMTMSEIINILPRRNNLKIKFIRFLVKYNIGLTKYWALLYLGRLPANTAEAGHG
jgi:hypothetical protein